MKLKGLILILLAALVLRCCAPDPSAEAFLMPEFAGITVDEGMPGTVVFRCRVSSMSQVSDYGLYYTSGSSVTKASPDTRSWTRVQGVKSGDEDAFSVCIDNLLGGATYSCRLFIGNGRVERLSETLSYSAPDNGSGRPPMKLLVEPGPDGLVCLPICGELRCVVDWGDGSKDAYVGDYGTGVLAIDSVSHIYDSPDASSGATSRYEPAYLEEPPLYEVLISGTVPALSTNGLSACDCIREVLDWGETELKDMNSAFKGCRSLEAVAAPGPDTFSRVSSFRGAFNGTALTSLPPNLFESAGGVSELNETFKDCVFLESLPEGLLSPLAGLERMVSTFAGCTSLRSIPAALFDSNRSLNAMEGVFMNCTALTGESPYTEAGGTRIHLYERNLRPDLFDSVERTYLCFFGCQGLSDYDQIPQNWKKP